MTPGQKAVILDYATELQTHDEPWLKFDYKSIDGAWHPCADCRNPLTHINASGWIFRRKPKAITVTIPGIAAAGCYGSERDIVSLKFNSGKERDEAMLAIRVAMEAGE